MTDRQIEVEVLRRAAAGGGAESLAVRVRGDVLAEYGQVFVDVGDAGVRNPAMRFGAVGSPAAAGARECEVALDTKGQPSGLYEVVRVRLLRPSAQGAVPLQEFWARRDFGRAPLEIGAGARSGADLMAELERRDAEAEKEFLTPLSTRVDLPDGAGEYSVFVFVRDVLVGTHLRFRGFELVPAGQGLGARDAFEFVNHFLRDRTRTGLQFAYDDRAEATAQQTVPACVVHFPTVRAESVNDARDFALANANRLLLALSLARESGGWAFEIVAIDRQEGGATKFAVIPPEVGQVDVGPLAGAAASTLEIWLAAVEREPVNGLLLSLYKEARRDPHRGFQFVRFWNLLELLELAGVGGSTRLAHWKSARDSVLETGSLDLDEPEADLASLKELVQQQLARRLGA